MKFTTKSGGETIEILASAEHNSVPVTVAAPSGTDADPIVKAGTPLTEAGASTTATGAVGILLYDVDTSANPNGALLVQGIIDSTKAQEHSGVTYDDALMAALNAAGCSIVMRTNTGVAT